MRQASHRASVRGERLTAGERPTGYETKVVGGVVQKTPIAVSACVAVTAIKPKLSYPVEGCPVQEVVWCPVEGCPIKGSPVQKLSCSKGCPVQRLSCSKGCPVHKVVLLHVEGCPIKGSLCVQRLS